MTEDSSRQFVWLGANALVSDERTTLDPRLGKALLDNITARLIVVDRENRFIYANREALDFYGMTVDQVIGRRVEDVLGEAIAARFRPIAPRIWAGEAARSEGWAEYPGRGERYLVELIMPYASTGGEMDAVAIFGRDHTDLRMREKDLARRLAELQASEALKSAIVDYALAAIVSTDVHGVIVEFNPAAQAMFGHVREAVIGRPASEVIVPPRFRAQHDEGMRRMAAGGPARILGRRVELSALRSDDSEFPVEMVLWQTNVGGSVFYTSSIVDITERHRATEEIARQREALRQSEKLSAMGTLLTGVAHELNNPLSIVMGRASLLEEKYESTELAADARRIREAAERCGRIVRTFLNMARNRPTERRSVVLNDMVTAAIDLLHYAFRTHGIALQLELTPGLPSALADGDQIGQIVLNLLVNAQQALATTPEPRRVLVQSGIEPGGIEPGGIEPAAAGAVPRIWLRVADNGPGVSDEYAARIFDSFFTTKPEGVGTGLGLAVSRSMAREHGGDLVLEPRSDAGGAAFRLSLPISEADIVAHAVPSGRASEAESTRRILVVDDEPELSGFMRDVLERAGYEVATAESGTVAVALLAAARFDAVVSDLRMPEMDGEELWRHIAAAHPQIVRHVLFVTGDTLSPEARRFLQESRCPALEKPFAKESLLEGVAGLW